MTNSRYRSFFIVLPLLLLALTAAEGNAHAAEGERESKSENHVKSYKGKETPDTNGKKEIDPFLFGAKGDGLADDTVPLQKALTSCSNNGWKCRVPGNKKFLVKHSLFIWGDADLEGDGPASSIIFDVGNAGYLINAGISGQNRLEKPFVGSISKITFRIAGGAGGRILYFWRTDGARVTDNIFDIGPYAYSATSSGNDHGWVDNGADCVRKNITIRGNIVMANSTNEGSEGIGLGSFDGALIENNRVSGVGDDPIGIHYSENVKVVNNELQSVDGRIYVSNSRNVEIGYNTHRRVASGLTGKFYPGIALLYIGFEVFEDNGFSAPTNIHVHHNTLTYPEGSIDEGGAIYIYAPRNITVESNRVVNDSAYVKATGFRMLPCPFSGRWSDPDGIDPAHVARVWSADISGNSMGGKYPLQMVMTGNCADYKGEVLIRNNSAADFSFYCDNVKSHGNIRTGKGPGPKRPVDKPDRSI